MLAVRYEHPETGKGIWHHYPRGQYDHPSELYDLGDRYNDFNSPDEDGIELEKDDFCAFKNIKQIREWITKEEHEFLLKEGFRVLYLKLSNFKMGKLHQICFKKKDIISQKDISDLVWVI